MTRNATSAEKSLIKKNYRTICIADHFTGFYMLQIFTERYFRTYFITFAWYNVLSVFKPVRINL